MNVLASLGAQLRAIFVEDFGLKALSLALALAAYAFIHGAQDAQRTMTVDVVTIPPPDSARRVLMTPVASVRVTVRGARALLDDLRSDDVGPLQLDLRSGRAEYLTIDPASVHVPPGLRVELVDPPALELRWEDLVDRDVPIQAALAGQPAAGYVASGAPRVEPQTVRARGPRTVVEAIPYVRAEAFDLSGVSREGPVERTVALDRPPQRVTFDVQSALVHVDVTRELIERQFARVPVQVVGTAHATAHPAEVDVKVKGPPEIVRALRTEQVVALVDLQKAGAAVQLPGSTSTDVRVEIDRCTVEVLPSRVAVRW